MAATVKKIILRTPETVGGMAQFSALEQCRQEAAASAVQAQAAQAAMTQAAASATSANASAQQAQTAASTVPVVGTGAAQIPTNAAADAKYAPLDHVANVSNPHGVTKAQVGLGNVTNDAQVKRSEMGAALGVATLDSSGKLTAAQAPSSNPIGITLIFGG